MGQLARRIVVGVVLAVVVIALIVSGPLAVTIAVGILSVLAADEMFRLSQSHGIRPVPVGAFAGIGALMAIAYIRGERGPVVFPLAIAACVIVSVAGLMGRRRVAGSTAAVAATTLAVIYVGALFSYVVVLMTVSYGRALTFGLILMVALNDVGSFAAGSRFGKHKLAPSLSPSKTWEGFAGGAVATLAAGAVAGAVLSPPFTVARGVVLAAIVAVAAPVGDLIESMIKRDAGAKDAGSLLPGHGGVLDRIDSLLVAAPLFFYAYRALVR